MRENSWIYKNSALLNKPGFHSTAAVSLTLEDQAWRSNDQPYSVDGSLQISDCNRTVTIDIDGQTEEEFNNTLHKLNTLYHVIGGAIDALHQYKLDTPERMKKKEAALKAKAVDYGVHYMDAPTVPMSVARRLVKPLPQ